VVFNPQTFHPIKNKTTLKAINQEIPGRARNDVDWEPEMTLAGLGMALVGPGTTSIELADKG